MNPDQSAAVGFTLTEAHLEPAEPGGVESALTDAGFADRITLTDLRHAPRDAQGHHCSTGSGPRALT
ncbi:hypothetical protein [Streptomyces sp. NPDC015125]|uniref:hypothetical protein n=1 Tax=Streptomyces sp. NPDC015125 TaxID=3364938 RepID=UPI0036FB87B8